MMVEPSVYRALFEMDDAPLLLVEAGLVVDANARARAAFGDAGCRGEIIGRELLALLAPVQPDGRASTETLTELASFDSTDAPRQTECLFEAKGESFWARVRVRSLAAGQGRLVLLSWRDTRGQRLAPGVGRGNASDASREHLSTMVDHEANRALPPDEEVPIAVLDGVVGALGVHSSSQDPLTAEERELLESISRQASEALQRARLLDEARARARRERLIRDTADRMQRATDLQSLIEIAAEELGSALGATHAYVRMGTLEELLRE